MSAKFYTSNEVVASLGTIPLNTGRGEGVFIKITPKNPAFTTKVGADGEVARSRSNDHRFDIEMTMMQTSDANILLSALHQLDLNAPNGAGVAAILIEDMSGTSVFVAPECWIVEVAEVQYGPEVEMRTWKLEAASGVQLVGGN
jgi:Protein of unknown function (DUF3277)